MDPLQLLKSANEIRNYQSFKDLLVGDYPIKGFSLVQTTHGKRLRVDTDHFYVFCPERYSLHITTPDQVNKLYSSTKMMIYRGRDASNLNW